MDLYKIIAELHERLRLVEEVITNLEALKLVFCPTNSINQLTASIASRARCILASIASPLARHW